MRTPEMAMMFVRRDTAHYLSPLVEWMAHAAAMLTLALAVRRHARPVEVSLARPDPSKPNSVTVT